MSTASEIVFFGSQFLVGRFRCRSEHELWQRTNRSRDLPTFVFPRLPVQIKQVDRKPVVATVNHMMLYNSNHLYDRDLIDPRGDACEFYSVSAGLLNEVARFLNVRLPDDPTAPFAWSHARCSASVYLRQRRLYQQLQSDPHTDPMLVEETFLNLIPTIFSQALPEETTTAIATKSPRAAQWEQVQAAKRYLGRHYREQVKICDVARAADCSEFHLCRLFKRINGMTIHQFLTQLRLRSSIECLLETRDSLTEIALQLGFSSHSHFTNAFRKAFDITPSELRKDRSLGRTVL